MIESISSGGGNETEHWPGKACGENVFAKVLIRERFRSVRAARPKLFENRPNCGVANGRAFHQADSVNGIKIYDMI